MMDKSQRTLQCISGGFFVVAFVSNLYLVRSVGTVHLSILWSIATVLLATAMFAGKKRLFAAGIMIHLIRTLLYSIGSLSFMQESLPFMIQLSIMMNGTVVGFLLCLVAYIFIFVSMRDNQKRNQFRIIAVVLLCIGSVINTHVYNGIFGILYKVLPSVIPIAFSMFVLQQPYKSLAATHNLQKIPPLNEMERIVKLKELLDAGAITQEEFDEKKKELLNL